jgi:hypothetical protein
MGVRGSAGEGLWSSGLLRGWPRGGHTGGGGVPTAPQRRRTALRLSLGPAHPPVLVAQLETVLGFPALVRAWRVGARLRQRGVPTTGGREHRR